MYLPDSPIKDQGLEGLDVGYDPTLGDTLLQVTTVKTGLALHKGAHHL